MPQNQINNGEIIKSEKGKMIAICSAKGGVGRTVIAVNLAIALAAKNIRTLLLDGCFQFGDVGLAMDLQSMFTIKDVMEQIDHMEEDSITHYLSRHESGVRVLPAPHRPEYADLITIQGVGKICNILLDRSDYLIVDTLPGLTESTLHFVDRADHIFLVTDLEMSSLKNTKLMLEILHTLELANKVQIIVNRSTMKSVIQVSDVPKILGTDAILYIPNQFEIVSKSLNIGVPFITHHRRADITKAILSIATQFAGSYGDFVYRPKGRSFVHSLFSKLKGQKG
ncbi:MAG: AAA family ATPase [Bacillota bacterium]